MGRGRQGDGGYGMSSASVSPREADAEWRQVRFETRKTPLACGNSSGTNRTHEPRRKPGDRYQVASYAHAIRRACERAYPPPPRPHASASPAKPAGKAGGNQTRSGTTGSGPNCTPSCGNGGVNTTGTHTSSGRPCATDLRRQHGIEAARVVLGHASSKMTELYAEIDAAKAVEIAALSG